MKLPLKLTLPFVLFFLILIFNFCSENATKPPDPPIERQRDTITVSVEQETHRSISIRLNHELNNPNDTYVLNRISDSDTAVVSHLSSHISDTVIIDDKDGSGLTIDTEYVYFAYRLDSTGIARDTSNFINGKTLPPTSHDFNWTEYTIGESGALLDVWGTDENNVYVTGGVQFGDSTFGLIHWNGVEWTPVTTQAGGSSIIGFGDNDIWLAGSGGVFHYGGKNWINLDNIEILHSNKPYTSVWGTSRENLYFTGTQGRIVHWNGIKATLMETPTEQTLLDIHGYNINMILATGSELSGDGTGLINKGDGWQILNNLNLTGILTKTVFAWNNQNYFIAGSQSFHNFNGEWQEILKEAPGIIQTIYGDRNSGDLVAAGDGNTLLHYNGIDWYNYSFQLNKPNSAIYSVFIINDFIFTAGVEDNKAIVLTGIRK